MVGKVNSNTINSYFLIYEIFDGDVERALKVSRKFARFNFTLTPKSIERYLILEAIEAGASDDDIIDSLSDEENKIHRERVERLRKEYKNGKRN